MYFTAKLKQYFDAGEPIWIPAFAGLSTSPVLVTAKPEVFQIIIHEMLHDAFQLYDLYADDNIMNYQVVSGGKKLFLRYRKQKTIYDESVYPDDAYDEQWNKIERE